MRTEGIIELLKQVPGLNHVGGAIDLADAETRVRQHPAALVVSSRETAERLERDSVLDLKVTANFTIVLSFRVSARDRNEDFEDLRDLILAAVNGAEISGYEQIEYTGGRAVANAAGLLAWALEFKTEYRLRS